MSEAAYFALEPEVAGEFGDGTVIDHAVDPPAVEDKRLVVSRRALDALMPGIGNECEIEPLL